MPASAMAKDQAHVGSASAADFVSGVSYVQVSVPASKAEEAVTFYKAAFDAQQVALSCCSTRACKTTSPLFCAQLNISGTSFLICGDRGDDSTIVLNERAASGVVVTTRLQVDNLTGAVEKASKAGAVLVGDCCVEEPCCGGKMARLLDPFGLAWDMVSASAPQAASCCG